VNGVPSTGATCARFSAWLSPVTAPVITRQCRSVRRSGTTTWRGSTEPAAASGRKG